MNKKTILKSCLAFPAVVLGSLAALQMKARKGNLKTEPDFLLVLGCTVHGSMPCENLTDRINKASLFLKEHPHTNAILCGGIVHEDQIISEAEVMKNFLVSDGIEEERLILEDKSKTTEENFKNAAKILEKMGIKNSNLAFLSSEYHLLRAGYIAKGCGLKLQSVPAKTTEQKRKMKAYLREFAVFPFAIFSK